MAFQQLHRQIAFDYPQEILEVAQLNLTWRELQTSCGLIFEHDARDTPPIEYALLQLPSGRVVSLYSNPPPHELAVVVAPAHEMDPFGLLYELLHELGLPTTCIKHEHELLASRPRWQVKRQDANGKVYTVGNWWSETQARGICDHLPRKYLRQQCWVELVDPAAHPHGKIS
jgi:hypothetical protein